MDAEGELVFTVFGWAVKSERPPHRKEMNWQTPNGNIYAWDGDGWYRLQPPERLPMKAEDLPHG